MGSCEEIVALGACDLFVRLLMLSRLCSQGLPG